MLKARDPFKEAEDTIRNVTTKAERYTKPVLSRYPLTFALLVTFSLAAILHGFELVAERIELFNRHPWLLIVIGLVLLIVTGTIYKVLESHK